MSDWGPFTEPDDVSPLRWTLRKEARIAHCSVAPHPLGFELRVDVDHETLLTQVHRQEVDADLHAATVEDDFLGKGWQ